MYTIYKGLKSNGKWKIGCDQAYPNRPIQQNLSQYFILEQHEDIMLASSREIELQKEHNVRVDGTPYYMTKVYASKAAKKSLEKGTHNFQTITKQERSQKAKETTPWKNSNFQSEMGKRNLGKSKPSSIPYAKKLNVQWKCETCGKSGKGLGNFSRYGHKTGECK